MNIQFKKGVLELCVLVLLSKQDYYGYELVEEISKYVDISEGTIYPLLRRLQKEGYLESYLQESSEGPPRKYYRITGLGKSTKDELVKEWTDFVEGVNFIICKEEKHE
ncbi:PadR family transcriptional regulator [Geosporobacter ferrireducens]|uniref:PadR family transcriptional regulator n=1 Tax=Geosporobacter ferrireducens TaxID=1424294 RepID=A0A1D8GKL2_9FIRM|nr:PadR family transcriptional regulator [Geosporobacter ferrireducens]AOT71402.1 PadR family transcriptional regulator [Geosporobacter ferrireducens]MTI57707.1 PadR family transcriptional regulator [Geosporobacter ferrireducens]